MYLIDISDLSIKLIFLFVPGILGAVILDTLTTHRKRELFNFIIHAYLIGIFSYGILHGITYLFRITKLDFSYNVSFLEAFLNEDHEVNVWEVFAASGIGIVISLLLVFIITNQYAYKIANKFKLSTSHGHSDVFDQVMSATNVQWVLIRRNNLMYRGNIRRYSEKDNIRELYLSDVDVYSDDGELLFNSDNIYFNFNNTEDFTIEVYNAEENKNEEQEGESDISKPGEEAEWS